MRFYDLDEVSSSYQYWVSIYYAIAALGGNEMGSRTNLQLVFWFFTLIFLVLVNGYVFGQMTIHVSEAQKQSSEFQKQIDEANTAMNDMKLHKQTQEEVRFYLLTTMGTQYEQNQLKSFFDIISYTLKEKISIEIFTDTMADNVVITTAISKAAKCQIPRPQDMTKDEHQLYTKKVNGRKVELLQLFVTNIKIENKIPDDLILEKYGEGTGLYFVQKGECRYTL